MGVTLVMAVWMLVLSAPEAVSKTRTVTGKVLASDGEALRGAVVQIKDTRTLHIRSFISQENGSYHFLGLNPDVDYEVFARYRGRKSPTKTVSQFNSSELIELDLVVPGESQPEP